MKVAYVISSENTRTILNDMIIPQLEAGNHGAEVLGMFFVFNNTYMLEKGSEIGERLQKLHEKSGMVLLACDKCAIERNIDDKLVDGAGIGCFPTLYGILGEAGVEQIITL
ncbi:DsrE/DsrF-like family protein [Hathewaya proteolytica DSM 3090]|uniref:DsrE/DsrF-like family protein n=1 Tax=Hathewaya proteolytica DSM 3090 TaxID=1121331 RepID=A0A1M6PUN3_9CLOT|nr:DsrE-related protein SaoD [Hathewaya proteolytica]SHK11627.1 DsrE/DsrF-like family protein [Hathewaya proteolytica DSM 3090]